MAVVDEVDSAPANRNVASTAPEIPQGFGEVATAPTPIKVAFEVTFG